MSSSNMWDSPHRLDSWRIRPWQIQWASAPDGQLQAALDKFEAILTPEQKKRLQKITAVPDTSSIIAFTTQLDNENAKRRSRCVATRLLTFLQSIQQFSTVVDTFVSSNPAIPALVWGSVKLAVLVSCSDPEIYSVIALRLANRPNPLAHVQLCFIFW